MTLLHKSCIDVLPHELWWQAMNVHPHYYGLLPISDSPHYRSILKVLNGVPLHETEYIDNNLVSASGSFTDILNSLMKDGWISTQPNIRVVIEEHGEIVICDGLHRSTAALSLHIPKIPADVLYRHHNWWKFRYALMELNDGAKLYQPINHSDFYYWPIHRIDTPARIKYINEYLHLIGNVKTGIDYGCNVGAISIGLARVGYDMFGIDSNEAAIKAATMHTNMIFGSNRVRFGMPNSLFPVDFIVVLSLLNHFWIDGRYDEGVQLFHTLSQMAPIIILDCPVSGDSVGGDSIYTNPDHVFKWCDDAAKKTGQKLVINNSELMRPLLMWWTSP